ncbi:hypothetical protein H0H93_001378 [Arthromyces matolae]|nr:hypothetical protein H0H93_001378 [Arthromyces matolae]
MTFADSTITRLHIVGPPGLLHYMAAMRLYTFRDSVHISPVEASMTPSPSPEPVFQDSNVTIYGLPIFPHTPTIAVTSSESSGEIETGQKRKRSRSPDSPTKRPAFGGSPSFKSREESVDPPNETGQKRQRSRSPNSPEKRPELVRSPSVERRQESVDMPPELLVGEKADEWRRRVIDYMFPGTNVQPARVLQDRDSFLPKTWKRSQNSSRQGSVSPRSATITETPSRRPRARLPPGFRDRLPKFVRETKIHPTLAYVIVGPRIRGKFDAKAAKELGVPNGPLRAELTKGNSITFKVEVDGEMIERVVRPEDCIGESESPGVALIFDIPTPAHIPSLIASFQEPFYAKFRSHRPEDFKDHAVRSIYHILGNDVIEDPRYIEFMNGFSPNAHHVISSRKHSPDPVTFTSVALSQIRMNQLDSDIFTIPHYSLSPKYKLKSIPNIPSNSSILAAGQSFNMRNSTCTTAPELRDTFHKTVTSNKPILLPRETQYLFRNAKANVNDRISSGNVPTPKGSDVKVISLGTGSAVPSKYRNVSSTLLQIPKWGNILLDIGEGTWGQLARQFGLNDEVPNNVWDFLRDLKCIFLNPPPSSPLYLVTIRPVHMYLRELSDIQDLGLDDPSGNGIVTVMSEALHWKSQGQYMTYGQWQVGGSEPWTDIRLSELNARDMCEALGLKSFNTVDVRHNTRCYGAVIKHEDGWSVVFSGDTLPANSLASAGDGATLLIHEATMADDQQQLAFAKGHSTFGQAIDIGMRMKAENILLTHFSARFPKMPSSALRSRNDGDSAPFVALAFDSASYRIGDMWKGKHYVKALEQSFRATLLEEGDEEDIEQEEKALAGMDVAVD